MQNILLANIGNRNITYWWKNIDKKYLLEKWSSFYEETKFLYENIEEFKNDIKLNILPNILEKYEVVKIHLFATNQGHEYDTYYEAKIIEYFLKNKYSIIINEIKFNPTQRDVSFKYFEDFFDNNINFEKYKLIISWSWWIPAMKEALNFYSVIKFKNSIILDVNEFSSEVIESNVDKEYLKSIDKEILSSMLKKYDYNWALSFLSKSNINSFELSQSIKYTLYRYNFDFKSSNSIYNNTKNSLNFLEKIEELGNLDFQKKLESDKIMIIELIDNIEVTFKKWEYTMLLWKIFRINEWLNRYFFEKEFWVSTEQKNWKYLEFENFIKNHENIKSFCESYENKNNWRLDYTSPNNYVLININKKFISGDNLFESWKKLEWWINQLSNNRNKSIMAHGWLWTSVNDVKKITNKIIEFKKELCGNNENTFDYLNSKILNYLK